MKTRIFTLLAVMMFASISAVAQSVEPIKGDVNGDSKVDVADIANIISIMAKGEPGYFYFGTTQPTAENYASLPGVIGSYTSIAEASGATATIATGETLYMMCPASWMDAKSVELEDEGGNPISFLEEKDTLTISGYVIYRTQVLNDEKTVVLKTKPVTNYYYYYAGWTQPTVSNVDTIIDETYPAASGSSTNHTAGKKTTSKSNMDYTSNTLYNANAKATYYVLVPTGHAIYDSLNNNVIASTFTSKGNITVGNQTHTIYASNSTSRNINAIIIK